MLSVGHFLDLHPGADRDVAKWHGSLARLHHDWLRNGEWYNSLLLKQVEQAARPAPGNWKSSTEDWDMRQFQMWDFMFYYLRIHSNEPLLKPRLGSCAPVSR